MKLRSYLMVANAVSLVVILLSLSVCYRYMLLEWNQVLLLGAVTGGAALASFIVHYLLTRPLTAAMATLSEEATRIAEGHFEAKVPVAGPAEFRQLARRFNQMSRELRASFERLHASEASRRELVANVSHDLRTPMASIQSFVEALEDDVISDKQTMDRYLQTIRLETKRLSDLIGELFELSRLQSGGGEWKPSPCHVDSLLVEALQGFSFQLEEKELEVRVLVPDTIAPVQVMAPEMKRVLSNLLHNAIAFSPPSGRLDIRAEALPGERFVRISVRDEGEGIAQQDQDRIFERFYRADGARTRKSGGAGLGLAIARSIVERHGGSIGVESAPGRGSLFWFTMPTAPLRQG